MKTPFATIPHLVCAALLCAVAALSLILVGCSPPPDNPDPLPQDPELARLLSLHNRARGDAGAAPVRTHDALTRAAQGHAQWMADNRRMSHTGANGSSFWTRAKAAGYNGRGGGENIAAGYATPEAVIDGWLHSSGHKRNILNGAWDDLGLGVARGGDGKRYWCAVFGDRGGSGAASAENMFALPPGIEAEDE